MGNTCCAENGNNDAEVALKEDKGVLLKPATKEPPINGPNSVTHNTSPFIKDMHVEPATTVAKHQAEEAANAKPVEPERKSGKLPEPEPAPVVVAPTPAPAPVVEKKASQPVDSTPNIASHYVLSNKPNQITPLVEARQRKLGVLNTPRHQVFEKEFAGFPIVMGNSCLLNTVDQSTYQGQHRHNVPHGFGRIIYANGTLLEGFFREGVPVGHVRKINPSGAHFEGEFKDNFPHGKGVYEDDKGKRFEVSDWQRGDMYGEVTITSPTGVQIYKGEMKKNVRSGQGVYYDEAENVQYTGTFVDNKLEGKGSLKSDHGYAYEGYFSKGVETGEGVMTLVDGRKVSGKFANGAPEGECILTTDYGKEYKTLWRKGALVSRI